MATRRSLRGHAQSSTTIGLGCGAAGMANGRARTGRTAYQRRAYKQEELLAEGPTPVLRVGNFFSSREWYYSDLVLEEEKYCDVGDLLYAWSASFGPRIWEGPRAIFHYHIWKIETSDAIDKKFLFYLLEADSETSRPRAMGSA